MKDCRKAIRFSPQFGGVDCVKQVVAAPAPAPYQPAPAPYQPAPAPYQPAPVPQQPTYQAGIRVLEASYGANRANVRGNATQVVAQYCDGQAVCVFFNQRGDLQDPAPGYSKSFEVRYTCNNQVRSAYIDRVDNGISFVELECLGGTPRFGARLEIVSATYGGNQNVLNKDNIYSQVRSYCNGYQDCTFILDRSVRDPAPGYPKDLSITYSCDGVLNTKYFGGPMVTGSALRFGCRE
jgi:hypothetical protein